MSVLLREKHHLQQLHSKKGVGIFSREGLFSEDYSITTLPPLPPLPPSLPLIIKHLICMHTYTSLPLSLPPSFPPSSLQSQIYMMEQEKRRMELEVSRMLLHKQKSDRLIFELEFQLKEERRKRKKERKGRRVSVCVCVCVCVCVWKVEWDKIKNVRKRLNPILN